MSWENQKRVKAPGIWCSWVIFLWNSWSMLKRRWPNACISAQRQDFYHLFEKTWENTFLVLVNLGTAVICHSYELWVHANIFLIEMPKTRLERQLGIQLKAATFNCDICAAPKYLFVCVYLHLYVYLYSRRDNSTQSRYMWSHVKSHVSTISHLDAHLRQNWSNLAESEHALRFFASSPLDDCALSWCQRIGELWYVVFSCPSDSEF